MNQVEEYFRRPEPVFTLKLLMKKKLNCIWSTRVVFLFFPVGHGEMYKALQRTCAHVRFKPRSNGA